MATSSIRLSVLLYRCVDGTQVEGVCPHPKCMHTCAAIRGSLRPDTRGTPCYRLKHRLIV